jgi:hypothetical protein
MDINGKKRGLGEHVLRLPLIDLMIASITYRWKGKCPSMIVWERTYIWE